MQNRGLSLGLMLGGISGGGPAYPKSPVPAWVEALRAPSGDLPLSVSEWKNGQYWLASTGICGVLDIWREYVDLVLQVWAPFDPALDIIPGFGISNQRTGALPGIGPTLRDELAAPLLVNGFTIQQVGNFGAADLTPEMDVTMYDAEFAFQAFLDINADPDAGGGYRQKLGSFSGGSGAEEAVITPPSSQGAATLFPDGTGAASVGGAPVTIPPYVGSTPPTNISLWVPGPVPQVYIERTVIWAPQPNADLPALAVL